MSDPTRDSEPKIDYVGRVHGALRTVVAGVLRQVAAEGLPGAHHFYLGIATQHPGVEMSESLRAQYPDEIVIVLQHDYRDLEADDEGFDVTLRFGGVPQRLRVPFTALTSFFDPSVQFLLRFSEDEDDVVVDLDDLAEDLALFEELKDDDAAERVTPLEERLAGRETTAAPSPAPVPAPALADAVDTDDETSREDEVEDGSPEGPGAEVVSIDAFRRR